MTVSHTSKENVSLRCHLDPTNVRSSPTHLLLSPVPASSLPSCQVFVIPNAFDATQFRPDPDNISPKHTINVIVLTRSDTCTVGIPSQTCCSSLLLSDAVCCG